MGEVVAVEAVGTAVVVEEDEVTAEVVEDTVVPVPMGTDRTVVAGGKHPASFRSFPLGYLHSLASHYTCLHIALLHF